MNITWKDVFNTSNKIWGWIETAKAGAEAAGYKYFLWSGWVLDLKGNKICLEEDLNGGNKILKPLAPGVKKEDITHGITNFCSWDRLKPQLAAAAGRRDGEEVIGVRATQDGVEIVLK